MHQFLLIVDNMKQHGKIIPSLKKLQHYGFSSEAILMSGYDQALIESKQYAISLRFK